MSESTERVAVIGAGVIGRVLAANLAQAGVDVTLVARGETLTHIRDHGVRLRTNGLDSDSEVPVADVDQPGSFDVVFLCLRANQLAEALTVVDHLGTPLVVLFMNVCAQLSDLHARFGERRVVQAFPGFGGFVTDDGVVEWLSLGAKQPTTIDAHATGTRRVTRLLRRTALPVAETGDMPAWMATHVVFVAGMAAALVRRCGDPVALAADRAELRDCVRAIRSGLRSLTEQGIEIEPKPIKVLFTRMPIWFAVSYWRRALPGPVGRITMAPFAWRNRFDEMALIWAEARQLTSTRRGREYARYLDRLQEEA